MSWLVIILLIVLIIILIWNIFIKPIIVNLGISFATKDEFEAIVSLDNYFNNLTSDDLYIRDSYTIEDYIKKYIDSYQEFTIFEKMNIAKRIYNIYNRLPKKLAGMLQSIRYKFVKIIGDNLELGYPHTLKCYIDDSDDTVGLIVLQKGFFEDTHDQQECTLLHEILHVYQKCAVDPSIEQLYNALGFYLLPDEEVAKVQDAINKLPIASNPDTPFDYYCIRDGNKYLMKTVYSPSSPNYFKDLGICLQTKKVIDLNFDSGLIQQGHPSEIVAEGVSRLILEHAHADQIPNEWKYYMVIWITQ